MKNLKISKKFLVTFGAIITVLIMVLVTAIVSLLGIRDRFTTFYNTSYQATNKSMEMRENIQAVAKFIGYVTMAESQEKAYDYIEQAQAEIQGLRDNLELLRPVFMGDQSLLDQIEETLNYGTDTREKIFAYARELKNDEAISLFFKQYMPMLDHTTELLESVNLSAQNNGGNNYNKAMDSSVVMTTIMIAISMFAVFATIVLAAHLTRNLTKPILEIEEAVDKIAGGNLDLRIHYMAKDELGHLSDRIRFLTESIRSIMSDMDYLLEEMSNGNFTVHTQIEDRYVGDFHSILNSIQKIKSNLGSTLSQINQAADEVSGGSEQVSNGAQALSQGATEQASAVEELAATITEISGQVKQSAEKANQASKTAAEVGEVILRSNQQMQEMVDAMADISEKSSEIGKINKVIEDIAFQTNILALNAAVEAARAGVAGKGFAVVADEVRMLAGKSAEASKNTSELIESSVKAVENGRNIAGSTARTLRSSVGSAKQVADTLKDSAEASKNQAEAITQITVGIDQISAVVQTNSATAEESAAASEELFGQASLLKTLVGKFRLEKTTSIAAAGKNKVCPKKPTKADDSKY